MKTLAWNVMKRSALLGIALLAALAVTRPALASPDRSQYSIDSSDYTKAGNISVSVDVPVASSLALKAAGDTFNFETASVSGFLAAVSLGFLGLGYESYSNTFPVTVGHFNFNVTMYDIFLNVPLGVIGISFGGGVGSSSFNNLTYTNNGTSYSNAWRNGDVEQYFASIGIALSRRVDLHVGYHRFSGAYVGHNGAPSANVTGAMYSAGLKSGF